MANGKKTIRRFSLYSEDLLDYRGIRCFVLFLHLISFLLGLTGTIIGILSFTNATDTPLPQTNCTLATTVQQQVEFPLSLLLLLTGIILVLTDIAITVLMCIIKWRRCGVLAIAWFLVITVCAVVWTVLASIYLAVVVPLWENNKETCDYLVLLSSLLLITYYGILAGVYLTVIVVVIIFDCNRWHNMRDVY